MILNDWAATLTCCWKTLLSRIISPLRHKRSVHFIAWFEGQSIPRVAAERNHVRYYFTQNHKWMLANDCSAGEGPGIYSNPARHSVCVNGIIIVNCEGSSSNYSSMRIGSTFHHWFNATLRGIAFCAWWSETRETFPGCSHLVNSLEDAAEKNWWQLSTFTTGSPPFIATGKVIRSCHSFHSPATSPLVHATANHQRQADHRVIRCLLLISEKFHHTYIIWSR
jgi:hypothetical protein